MTAEYEQALNAVREATKKFYATRDAYHSLKVGDDEFLAAKAVYNEAKKVFDEAYAKEEALPSKREAAERIRIGDYPTCDECDEQHNQDVDCSDWTERLIRAVSGQKGETA